MTQLSFPNPSSRGPFAFAESIKTPRSPASTWTAVGAHALAIVLLLTFATRLSKPALSVPHILPSISLPDPPSALLHHVDPGNPGGSGSNTGDAAAQQGHPPKPSDIQLLPPSDPPRITPLLPMEASVKVPDVTMTASTLPDLGKPSSTGHTGSLGDHGGNSVGDRPGSNYGDHGPGPGGPGDGIVRGTNVHPPTLTYSVEPEFSEDARQHKFSGNVQVYVIVDEQGRPTHVRVARGVGMGLDEKAVEAVRQYKFKPATQNGKPVKVDLYIDVNFRIF